MNEFLLETTQEAVSEVESAKPKPFRKFTVVKHKEAPLQADSPNWDFNNNSDVQNVNFSNCQIDDEYSEAEDFFDENCNFKKDNLINCRDAEGQDTITSLKNNHFLKKLGKKKYSTNLTSSFSDFRTGQEAQGKNSLSLALFHFKIEFFIFRSIKRKLEQFRKPLGFGITEW
jgi:hypothetical protein